MLQLSKRTWNIELSDMHGVKRSIQLLGNRLKGLTFPWKCHILNSQTCVVNACCFAVNRNPLYLLSKYIQQASYQFFIGFTGL